MLSSDESFIGSSDSSNYTSSSESVSEEDREPTNLSKYNLVHTKSETKSQINRQQVIYFIQILF
jgi:hypothetical protein